MSPRGSWQAATFPVPGQEPEGWAPRGLGGVGPSVVDGAPGLTLMWSQEMPDAGRCLLPVTSSPGTTNPGHGSGEVSDSRVLLV